MPKYTIVISQQNESVTEDIYRQTVESLDLPSIINAINNPPRRRSLRSDAGKPRTASAVLQQA